MSTEKKITIAILGTRGIPNHYGGFEQFAEYLSVGLSKRGFDVSVYNSHKHPYQEKYWHGIRIIHQFDPEYRIGTAGQFAYDLNCILDCRKRKFDLVLQLGYTSSSIWHFLFPENSIILTNMDGLEWKRTKYSKPVQFFLKYAERLAVKKSDCLIADSLGIKKYLMKKYGSDATYIPYGAEVFDRPDPQVLDAFNLRPYQYDMLIARLEPENSIEMILDGRCHSGSDRCFIVVANSRTTYGSYLREKYSAKKRILFLGAIYDINILNNLRYYSNLYFHGHTVGGTNPSLLEAMASHALIAANQNQFNSAILNNDAYYFSNAKDVELLLNTVIKNEHERNKTVANVNKIKSIYSWENIISSYEQLLVKTIKEFNKT